MYWRRRGEHEIVDEEAIRRAADAWYAEQEQEARLAAVRAQLDQLKAAYRDAVDEFYKARESERERGPMIPED